MSEQRQKILTMLAEGKITADEAERLLAAMDSASQPPREEPIPPKSGRGPKFLHVQVQSEAGERGKDNVNIRIPLMLLKAGIKLGTLVPEKTRQKLSSQLNSKGLDIDLNQLDAEKIDILIRGLEESSIEVDSDKDKVRIFVD